MNEQELLYTQRLFGKCCKGEPLTDRERTFLEGLLSDMNEAQKAGCVAAIIEIMLRDC